MQSIQNQNPYKIEEFCTPKKILIIKSQITKYVHCFELYDNFSIRVSWVTG